MFEDKKLGLKIAEEEAEEIWTRVKNESEELIKQSNRSLIIQKAMRELALEKLKKYKK